MDHQEPPIDLRFQQYVNDPILRGRKAPALTSTPNRDPYGNIKTRMFKRFLGILANAEDDD